MALPIVFMEAFFEEAGGCPLIKKKGEVVKVKYIITALFKNSVKAF